MIRSALKAVLAAVFCAGLSACIPGTPPAGAVLATPPIGKTNDAAYVARKDGAFTIPAVTVEKVPAQFRRQTVAFQTAEAPGTIIINPSARYLHLVTGKNKAIRYGIAVGRAGFEWSGVAIVNARKQWPTWTPPAEMIARQPDLAKWEKGQPGGPTNPLGARALYLTTNGVDYGYRIHGTPEWQSIGSNASSGCIRMINQDVIDLFTRVPDGAKVIVLNADGSTPTGLKLPPPAPKVAKEKAIVIAAVVPVMPALPTPPPRDAELIAPAAVVIPAPVAPVAVIPACTVALVDGTCPTPAAKP